MHEELFYVSAAWTVIVAVLAFGAAYLAERAGRRRACLKAHMVGYHIGSREILDREFGQRVPLSFDRLRCANRVRLPQFKDAQGRPCHDPLADGHDWALSQWSNAVAGEVGEAANLIKKIERGDFTLDEARQELGFELADVVIYLDLLAHRAGIDLGEAVTAKFDRTSRKVEANVFLGDGEPPNDLVDVLAQELPHTLLRARSEYAAGMAAIHIGSCRLAGPDRPFAQVEADIALLHRPVSELVRRSIREYVARNPRYSMPPYQPEPAECPTSS